MLFYMKDNFCTFYKLVFHRLEQCLVANGHTGVAVPQQADVLIAGVCASFEADVERSSELLDDLVQTGKQLYVIGCMVRVRSARIPYAHLFYTWEYERLLLELVPKPIVSWEKVGLPSKFRCYEDYRVYNPSKHFVGICSGCAFDCSYCSHKLGAGNLASRNMEEILEQIQELLSQNVKTIVLSGIDTASYGKDIGYSFPVLMERILTLAGNRVCYHIAQFNPEGISSKGNRDQMIRCCCNPCITDLQLPIQTTSPRLLGLMNRNYDTSDIANFIEQVCNKNRNLFFRTDIIVGFPTETEEEFRDSLEFATRHFQEVAVYRYEHQPGTAIEKVSLPQCDSEIVDRRMQKAIKQLGEAGRLVHLGGQDTASLLLSDKKKSQMRGA